MFFDLPHQFAKLLQPLRQFTVACFETGCIYILTLIPHNIHLAGGYIWGYEHGNLGPNDTTFNTSSGLVMPLHYPSYPKQSDQEISAIAWITG